MITSRRRKRFPRDRRMAGRSGAVIVEAAISLTLFCLFLVFMLDFTLASFRTQMLNHIAHRVGREAIIHGPNVRSTYRGGVWGPNTFTTTLDASDPVAVVARTVSAGLPQQDITITVSWPSGSNAIGSPVLVEVELPWSPSLARPFFSGVMTLQGRSRQFIAH